MDPKNYVTTRTVRVASHQGVAGQTFAGSWTNSNFQVNFQGDLQRYGLVNAVSLQSIGFPNLFPNIVGTRNRGLVRGNALDQEAWRIPVTIFSWVYEDGTTQSITYTPPVPPALPLGSHEFIDVFNYYSEFVGGPVVSYDLSGRLTLTFPRPAVISTTFYNSLPGFVTTAKDPFTFPGQSFYSVYYGWPIAPSAWQEVVVPEGFYDNIQLGNVITAQLDALFGAGWTINPTLNFDQPYKIVAPASKVVSIVTPYTPEEEASHYDYNPLFYLMGFMDQDQGLAPAATLQASQNPSLQGETVAYVHSQALCQQVKSFPGEGPPDFGVFTIPIKAEYGAMVEWAPDQFQNPFLVFDHGWDVRFIDFQIRNVFNEPLYLPDNQQMWVTLKLWYRERQH